LTTLDSANGRSGNKDTEAEGFLKIVANKSKYIFDSFEIEKVRLFELETSQKHTCCAIHHNVHDGAYPLCHAPFGSFLQVMLLIQLASTN
jgi:hypothetical protein